jgi:hypothetical protein
LPTQCRNPFRGIKQGTLLFKLPLYLCRHIYIYIYIYIYTHTYIYICVCVCVCVYKHIKIKFSSEHGNMVPSQEPRYNEVPQHSEHRVKVAGHFKTKENLRINSTDNVHSNLLHSLLTVVLRGHTNSVRSQEKSQTFTALLYTCNFGIIVHLMFMLHETEHHIENLKKTVNSIFY